jgi:hypothetical protein
VAARGKELVTKSLPAFIARAQFGQILERVSGNRERFLVTKKGEAKAIGHHSWGGGFPTSRCTDPIGIGFHLG